MSEAPAAEREQVLLEVDSDWGFADWISRAEGTVVVSTYKAQKLAMIGWNGQQISFLPRDFDKPMGMAVEGSRIAVACRDQLLILADAPSLAMHAYPDAVGQYDALYIPRVAYLTGELDIHDMAFGNEGLWFVNTRFCCLSQPSTEFNFIPRWQPDYIADLTPEDRCHLNGLALQNGEPAWLTALSETDEPDGWREVKVSGGVLIDYKTREVVIRGLSMPHSPRWHDGKLWLLNSGRGEVLEVDTSSGEVNVVCTLPGFVRGMCFVDGHVLVGLSLIRPHVAFEGLPIQSMFPELHCGVAVISEASGELKGMFKFTQGGEELYDVQFIPKVRRPAIVNTEQELGKQALSAPAFGYWLRPKDEKPQP